MDRCESADRRSVEKLTIDEELLVDHGSRQVEVLLDAR
jgi:hypothetical protein